MSGIVRPYRLELPEIPTKDIDDSRVFDFVKGIFKLNGVLDLPNGNTIDEDFFSYGNGDFREKVFHVTKFLVAQEQKPTLILSATSKRKSESSYNESKDRSRANSNGYQDIGTLGHETYEISTIPATPGIHEADLVISASREHCSGSTSGRWPKTDFLGGSLPLKIQQENIDQYQAPGYVHAVNRQTLLSLVDLL